MPKMYYFNDIIMFRFNNNDSRRKEMNERNTNGENET